MTRRRTLLPVENEPDTALIEETAPQDAFEPETEYEQETELEDNFWDQDEVETAGKPRGVWLVPALCIAAIAAWTALFIWVNHGEMLSGPPLASWVEWISTWSIPVILVIGLWLLAMRNSRREANRFTDAARALSFESAQLEGRLSVVNRELALARDFIASQSRDLESLGRIAAERLATNADRIQALIHDNHAQVDAIGTVSTTALANMESLRDQLPVVANAARDMTNQIGAAGNTATGQVESLVSGLHRLNQFGEASEHHVARISERVGNTLELFDEQMTALGAATEERFAKLRQVSDGFRADLALAEEQSFASIRKRATAISEELRAHDAAQRETEEAALDIMRERIAKLSVEGERLLVSLGDGREEAERMWNASIEALEARMSDAIADIAQTDEAAMASAHIRLTKLAEEAGRVDDRIEASLVAFDEEMARRKNEAEAREAADMEALEMRLAALDERVSERQGVHLAHVAGLAESGEALAARLEALDAEMARIAGQAADTQEGLGSAAQDLADRLSQSRAVLEDNGQFIARLTDDSVRLLEIIRSGADHSQGALSDAVGAAEARLTAFGQEAERVHALIGEADARGASVAAQIESARESGAASLENLTAMEARMGEVATETERLAERTGQELRDAIAQLADGAASALDGLRANQREVVEEMASRIAEDSRTLIAEAIRENARETIDELEAAVARASENGRDTTRALREQLAKVNELTGNLEQRVAYARERAEEKVDSDFSRRMALITEALNSSSIDIAKAFDNEVSDTQWAHYLRGDRGIFTRRAVRLLDRSDTRAVAEVYNEDGEFRETVNRYIHDFEAMLREVLATRDGNAMAVTLLSSDMGKLYVALAQAIDRLRN